MTFSCPSAPPARSYSSIQSCKHRFQPCRSRRGSTLASALLLVATAALVSAVALQRGLDSWRLQSASTAQKIAFYMAESGIAEARDDLAHDGSGNVGSRELPALYGSGAFWVETVTDEHGVSFITSTGLYDGTASRLSQAVRRPPLPLVEHGFFGRYGVTLGEGTVVREYVPDEGGEEAGGGEGQGIVEDVGELIPPGLGGLGNGNSKDENKKDKNKIALPEAPFVGPSATVLVGSDAGIELAAGASVAGAALPGPEHVVLVASGAAISGSTLPERDAREMPAIAMPLDEASGALVCLPAVTNTLASGTHALSSVSIAPLAALTIVGPASVSIDRLDVGAAATLRADTSGGAVHVYVAHALTVGVGATVGASDGDASRFVVLVGGRGDSDSDDDGVFESPVVWASSADACLALYAPNSAVDVPSGTHWIGGIAAQSLRVGDHALLELDSRLRQVAIESRDRKLMAWRVLEIPAAEKAVLRRDVVKEARERGDTLPCPCSARVPATEEFLFETPEGKKLVYRGTSIVDLTLAKVASMLPPAVDVDVVPPFAKYSEDDIEEVDDVVSAEFQNAWEYAASNLPPGHLKNIESGDFPPGIWTAVVTNGVSLEPYAKVFNDPNVREGLEDELDGSWLPTNSKKFIEAVLANGP
jgi:hypothetical protein